MRHAGSYADACVALAAAAFRSRRFRTFAPWRVLLALVVGVVVLLHARVSVYLACCPMPNMPVPPAPRMQSGLPALYSLRLNLMCIAEQLVRWQFLLLCCFAAVVLLCCCADVLMCCCAAVMLMWD